VCVCVCVCVCVSPDKNVSFHLAEAVLSGIFSPINFGLFGKPVHRDTVYVEFEGAKVVRNCKSSRSREE